MEQSESEYISFVFKPDIVECTSSFLHVLVFMLISNNQNSLKQIEYLKVHSLRLIQRVSCL